MEKNQTDQQSQQTDKKPQAAQPHNEKENGTDRADKKQDAQPENKKLQDTINPKEDVRHNDKRDEKSDEKRDDKRTENTAGEKSWQKK